MVFGEPTYRKGVCKIGGFKQDSYVKTYSKMGRTKGQNTSNTGEEPPRRRQAMTASYRRGKTSTHLKEPGGKSVGGKAAILNFRDKIGSDVTDVEKNTPESKENEEEYSGDSVGEEDEYNDNDNENENEGIEEDTDEERSQEREEQNKEESGEGSDDENEEESIEEDEVEDELAYLKDLQRDEYDYELYDKGHDHVANHLLRMEDRGIITCKQYTNKMHTWHLEDELEVTRKMIQQTILFPLYKGSYKSANKVLVSAFVERWHPETTSFHMPFGEATITLDDVQQLLRIPIIGKTMGKVKWEELDPLEEWISNLIGIDVDIVKAELESCGFSVRTSWIINNLSRLKNKRCKASPEKITRGFLLVLLGCTLFQDRSGDKVKVKYLYYLQDLKRLDKWAWGAGTLANLYRMLSKASTYGTKGVSGYLTLLEAWIYEHCPKQRPQINKSFNRDDIRTQKWKPSFHMADDAAAKHLKFVRGELDSMTNEDFVWTPYRKRSEDPHEVAWFCGCLVIENIEEPYHPNRVVRQFGRVQDKPKCPILAQRSSRKKVRGYLVKFNNRGQDYEEYHCHLMPENFRGPRAKKNGQCTKEYDEWYQSVALIKLNHELPASVFASAEYEEGRWKRKALDLVDAYVKKGVKATKEELINCIKSIGETIREGSCVASDVIDRGETSSIGTKKKSKSSVDYGKRKLNDDIETMKKKTKAMMNPGGIRICEPSDVGRHKKKEEVKGKGKEKVLVKEDRKKWKK